MKQCPKPIIAIHQPNFAPWSGFFHKMTFCDSFVYLDTAPFSRNSFQNRTRILTQNGAYWLTVPVLTKGKSGNATNVIEINNQIPWQRKHLKTLKLNYSKSPFFNDIYPEIESIYRCNDSLLVSFNIRLLEILRSIMGVTTPLHLASDLDEKGSSTIRLISLVDAIDGKTYLSGSGGKEYMDETAFQNHSIKLVYQKYIQTPYPQNHDGFVPGLSILDTLFSLGPKTLEWIIGGNYE